MGLYLDGQHDSADNQRHTDQQQSGLQPNQPAQRFQRNQRNERQFDVRQCQPEREQRGDQQRLSVDQRLHHHRDGHLRQQFFDQRGIHMDGEHDPADDQRDADEQQHGLQPDQTNLPSAASVTNGMSTSSTCGSASLSVASALTNSGCLWTNAFTITATDTCGNSSSTNVVYNWTVNTTPPTINGTPTNSNLGCNPTNLPSAASVTNGMSASSTCGSASLSVASAVTNSGCLWTNAFTITATDTCGNSSSTNVVYTWTVNTIPPTINGTPTNSNLGCNPTNLPSAASVTNGMSASSTCGSASLSVASAVTNSGCLWTNAFTITATDTCGNSSSTNVVYTWTVNTTPPTINGTPTNSNLGCNPTNLPSAASVTNGMSASSTCGSASLSVSSAVTNSGCLWTNAFTITATDTCGKQFIDQRGLCTWTGSTRPRRPADQRPADQQ